MFSSMLSMHGTRHYCFDSSVEATFPPSSVVAAAPLAESAAVVEAETGVVVWLDEAALIYFF